MEWRATGYPGYWVNADGEVRGPSDRILRQKLRGRGYPSVTVTGKRVVYVHSLTCEAFHGARPSAVHQVAHWNGDPSDNRADNLRWATPAENSADAVRHGTSSLVRGGTADRNGNAKLTWDAVRAIRREAENGATQASLAIEHGLGKSQIHNIVARKQWREEWRP